MYQSLPSANGRNELDGSHWNQLNSHICPILGAMVIAEQAGVRMMEEYFEIEASKSTPQYGFRKGLKIFGDKGYQAAKEELEKESTGKSCIDMLSWEDLTWDIRKRALGYLIYLKRKISEKMNGREYVDGRPQRNYITKEESSSSTVLLYALMGL